MKARLLQALSEAATLVLVAAVLGVVANHFSSRPAPLLGRPQLRIPVLSTLRLPHAKAIFDARSMRFVDARDPAAYAAGHIPGAVNVPSGAVPDLPAAGGTIVYCDSADGTLARSVAEELSRRGVGNLYVFPNGWTEWSRAGFPVEP